MARRPRPPIQPASWLGRSIPVADVKATAAARPLAGLDAAASSSIAIAEAGAETMDARVKRGFGAAFSTSRASIPVH